MLTYGCCRPCDAFVSAVAGEPGCQNATTTRVELAVTVDQNQCAEAEEADRIVDPQVALDAMLIFSHENVVQPQMMLQSDWIHIL